MVDRQLSFHVEQNGRIAAVVTCPALGIAVSRYVYNRFEQNGWKYPLQLLDRVIKEWDGLEWRVVVTFETYL